MPSPTHDTPTVEMVFPKELFVEFTSTTSDLAKKYMLQEFAAIWDVDSGVLSEWLAENDPSYAALTDEDEIDLRLDEFTMALDGHVRQALDDFRIADEVEKV